MTTPENPDEQQPVEPVHPYPPVEPEQPSYEPEQPTYEPVEPAYEPVLPEPLQPEPAYQPEPVTPEPLVPEPAYDPVLPEPVQPDVAPPTPSLYDRLAQLEPDDDDEPLFDEDPFDEDAFDEEAPAEPAVDVPPTYLPQVAVPAATEPVAVEPAAQPEPSVPRRQRRARRGISLPIVALLLMTALMAAATTYLWLQVREHDRTEQARRTGLEASRDAARLLFSYDYRTLEKDFSTGRALTTGEFRKQYDKTTTKVVSDVAKQYKAVVKADVVSAGVVRATPEQVVTIVYVNQVTTSTRVTGEKVDLSRVKMTLAKVGDRWLVTAVNAL